MDILKEIEKDTNKLEEVTEGVEKVENTEEIEKDTNKLEEKIDENKDKEKPKKVKKTKKVNEKVQTKNVENFKPTKRGEIGYYNGQMYKLIDKNLGMNAKTGKVFKIGG